jgi:hypothetical protein
MILFKLKFVIQKYKQFVILLIEIPHQPLIQDKLAGENKNLNTSVANS